MVNSFKQMIKAQYSALLAFLSNLIWARLRTKHNRARLLIGFVVEH
jgi:hypothetical protein